MLIEVVATLLVFHAAALKFSLPALLFRAFDTPQPKRLAGEDETREHFVELILQRPLRLVRPLLLEALTVFVDLESKPSARAVNPTVWNIVRRLLFLRRRQLPLTTVSLL